jgi:chemotaxis protein histidine kinase CheA
MAKQLPIEIFMPPNMLKAKVGGTGVGLDMGAVKRAEMAMENLKTEFHDWINDDVAKLAAARDAYKEKQNAETLGALFRSAHDLKGQALTFEHPFVARVSASLCRLLDGKAPPMALINAHVETVRLLVKQNIKDKADPTTSAVATELESRVAEVVAA